MNAVRIDQKIAMDNIAKIITLLSNYKQKIKIGRSARELLDVFMIGAANGLSIIIYNDKAIVGFAIIEPRIFDQKRTLDIIATYIEGSGDGYKKGWEEVKKIAEEKDAELIMCETMVGKRWDAYFKRRLKPRGFEPVLTTYIMEVDNGRRE